MSRILAETNLPFIRKKSNGIAITIFFGDSRTGVMMPVCGVCRGERRVLGDGGTAGCRRANRTIVTCLTAVDVAVAGETCFSALRLTVPLLDFLPTWRVAISFISDISGASKS